MYSYELLNNHYIVDIDNKKYLIDTGSPLSFWVTKPVNQITIEGNNYNLLNKPFGFNLEELKNLVGIVVDGFIGMDIISKTGLTIYKDNKLEFKIKGVEGTKVPMTRTFPLLVSIGSNLMNGKFVIDTGAKYGYGISGLFYKQTPFECVHDYNPNLGHLESNIYHLNIVIGGELKTIDVCDNKVVGSTLLSMGSIMVGNITSLFNEVCVINTRDGEFIFK